MSALRARLARWRIQHACLHHWHSADAMILWRCCWCGKDVDGMPADQITCCNERAS